MRYYNISNNRETLNAKHTIKDLIDIITQMFALI